MFLYKRLINKHFIEIKFFLKNSSVLKIISKIFDGCLGQNISK